jgi:hypothetical protein
LFGSISRGVVVVASVLVASIATASPWLNSSGSLGNGVSYHDGANSTDHFGDPVVTDSFTFFPASFTAASTVHSDVQTTNDTASVVLTPSAQSRLTTLHVDFAGDYSNLGEIPLTTYSATLRAQNAITSESVESSTSGDFGVGANTFTDSLALNLPGEWKGDVLVELLASVSAQGGVPPVGDPSITDGGPALIQLKLANLSVTSGPVAAVPLPAAIATFPLLAGVAAIAHRKLRGKKA